MPWRKNTSDCGAGWRRGVAAYNPTAMNTDRNRAAAQRFFELFSASDLDGVMALMTDDATWRIPGKKELTPTAGVYTKERIGRLFRRMLDNLIRGSAA